jgi:preprotein translocase subunit SecY
MFKHIRNVLAIPELRNRLVLTLVLLAVYRLGFLITLPFVNQEALAESLRKRGDSGVAHVMNMLSLFSASNIGQMTIFGLGIMPYISASIIFQLLGTVYPPLEKLQKEGEAGRKKINEWTRYATVVICFVQSYFWIVVLSGGQNGESSIILRDFDNFYMRIVCAITMTTGSVLLMWIGEQIDEYGLGNGVSLLIMAGILSRLPSALGSLVGPAFTDGIALGGRTGIDRLMSGLLNLDYSVSSFYGGTGLLICVSVAIDLIHKIDSYLVARQQRGLLDVQE